MSDPDVVQQEQLGRVLVNGSGQIKNYLRRYSSDASEVADFYQEAVARVLERSREQTIHNPIAYALQVAKHLLFSRRAEASAAESHELECPAPSPEDSACGQQRLDQLQRALDNMPPLRRRVFIRRRLHGESREAIAKAMGITEAAVKKHITRAMSDLQRELDGVQN
ncbi:RNA polymerase sigma factor [Gilvimarinus sp. DA14]|uniref:RNA polymerase sigma factor n=1 Tax=Gilvimarinus sp. DA14 TaxID=2956798 RepID=UPI0020B88130|nr:sigma-70 family RNA polymerase sigma factor [Gilvimarinus sp. DA14]UTF60233.1 sigma-70 family RNA polymerase sigma factor [Gilvimarinus sp. DA14]